MKHRAFTLIELLAVIAVLAILVGVVLPKYFDHSSQAKTSADAASIAGITTALQTAYAQHRMTDASSSEWVTDVTDIASVMETGILPNGIVVSGSDLQDQSGNTYTLTAETATSPAALTQDTGGSGGGGS
ncbi:MAG TPA: prepilin-type N-terminal cleavage/methylation domain-containing protein [Phycisphaerales bacterium]|nr:prepilin-type N-terminal cleavage/methylation domain-containing protein [Phycisphaerales bacterium]